MEKSCKASFLLAMCCTGITANSDLNDFTLQLNSLAIIKNIHSFRPTASFVAKIYPSPFVRWTYDYAVYEDYKKTSKMSTYFFIIMLL